MDGNPGGVQYPQIRGTEYEAEPVIVGGGPPQTRTFRDAAGAQYTPPAYSPAGHFDQSEHGYSYQSINGQYVNTGKR